MNQATNVPLVPVNLIDDPLAPMRTGIDEDKLIELRESIREHGVLEPILVAPDGSGRFEVIAGHRRLMCVRSLGSSFIPAIIRESDEMDKVIVRAHENLYREDVGAVDEGNFFRSLLDSGRYDVVKIGELIGKGESYVRQRLASIGWRDDVKTALVTGEISFSVARELASVEDDNLRSRMLIDAVHQGATVRKIADWKRAVDDVQHAIQPELREPSVPGPAMPQLPSFIWCDVHDGLMPSDDVVYIRICRSCGGSDALASWRYSLTLGGDSHGEETERNEAGSAVSGEV